MSKVLTFFTANSFKSFFFCFDFMFVDISMCLNISIVLNKHFLCLFYKFTLNWKRIFNESVTIMYSYNCSVYLLVVHATNGNNNVCFALLLIHMVGRSNIIHSTNIHTHIYSHVDTRPHSYRSRMLSLIWNSKKQLFHSTFRQDEQTLKQSNWQTDRQTAKHDVFIHECVENLNSTLFNARV